MSVSEVPEAPRAAGERLDAADIRAEVLAVVTRLAEEMHPHQKGRAPGLRGDLDRDFGLDSLGRVELIHRLEATFNITLPDRLFAEAGTPDDLARAITKAGPAVAGHREAAVTRAAQPGALAAPEALQTLTDVLAWHATRQPTRAHAYLSDGDQESAQITYADLLGRAKRVATGLSARGLEPGARIALMLPTGVEYFAALLGTLMAGGVPAPSARDQALTLVETASSIRRRADVHRRMPLRRSEIRGRRHARPRHGVQLLHLHREGISPLGRPA